MCELQNLDEQKKTHKFLFVFGNFPRNSSYEFEMESTLTIADIMPKPQRLYDKNRAPKLIGQPTVAYFHVTGMHRPHFISSN